MENKIRRHTHTCIPNSHPSLPSLHKDSHTISKTKPKIRIIHVFAPEIIKTDVENFRELVQKLTGKPSGEMYCKKKKPIRITARRGQEPIRSTIRSGSSGLLENNNPGMDQTWGRVKVKVKEEVGAACGDEISSGGYLGGFSDLEGFISELDEFPFFPMDGTQMQGFEEYQLLQDAI